MWEKPVDKMTQEERDSYYKSFSGLTYHEFCEQHKGDTLESIAEDLKKHIKATT